MKVSQLYIVILLGLFSNNLFGQYQDEYLTDDLIEAYEHIKVLDFTPAQDLLQISKATDPSNPLNYYFENYIDFLSLFILEQEDLYESRRNNKSFRLKKIRDTNPNSPYYLFAQAEVLLQWSLIKFKFEEYFSAFSDISKAYKLLEENHERHPDFVLNYRGLGLIHSIVGTFPDNYKWGIKLLGGLEGTIKQGNSELARLIEDTENFPSLFLLENQIIYATSLLHFQNQKQASWEYVKSSLIQTEKSLLTDFISSHIAMHSGHNDEAISILEKRTATTSPLDFAYLYFILGKAKLNRLDENADQFFNQYLDLFSGKNYIKESYQKLAWHNLLFKDEAAYQRQMESCMAKGNALIEEDKQALYEAKQKSIPHKELLKARLLYDGAYYSKAKEVLEGIKVKSLIKEENKIEYYYRLGRVYHDNKEQDLAIEYYQKTLSIGSSSPLYFACNASLQLGLLFEEDGNYDLATFYFNKCLDLEPAQYRTGIHQKAKTGLNRIQ